MSTSQPDVKDALVLLGVLVSIVVLNTLVDVLDWLNIPLFGDGKEES